MNKRCIYNPRCIRLFLRGIAVLLSLVANNNALAQPGTSGFPLLKVGISGQGIAMGDAMSAYAHGAAATFYNPAGMLSTQVGAATSQLILMHKEWIQDTRTEFLAASTRIGDQDAIGISMNSTTISDIEIRTRPGTPEGTFTARNYILGLSYARSFQEDLHIGITGKFLYEKILIDEASGYAFDLGIRYLPPVEHVSVGIVAANIGQMSVLRNDRTALPALLRIGPAYSSYFDDIAADCTLASDLLYVFPEKKSYLSLGMELVLLKLVAARTGYQFGSQGRGLSAGLGVRYSILSLDYAYTSLSADLGNTHTVSLALEL